jgi:NADH-quinone oxidoreductase subunit C
MVSVSVPRANPVAPTVSTIWEIAQWQEREVYDLFGVRYEGHPDLRRLFLDDNWQGHPLRKDYQDDDMLELPK